VSTDGQVMTQAWLECAWLQTEAWTDGVFTSRVVALQGKGNNLVEKSVFLPSRLERFLERFIRRLVDNRNFFLIRYLKNATTLYPGGFDDTVHSSSLHGGRRRQYNYICRPRR
jgi:hypothetical protein